jgi:hypothetical protein
MTRERRGLERKKRTREREREITFLEQSVVAQSRCDREALLCVLNHDAVRRKNRAARAVKEKLTAAKGGVSSSYLSSLSLSLPPRLLSLSLRSISLPLIVVYKEIAIKARTKSEKKS